MSLQACFWEASPMVVIALVWLFVFVLLLVMRTVLYLRGEVRFRSCACVAAHAPPLRTQSA